MTVVNARRAAALLVALVSVAAISLTAAPANAELWAVPRTSPAASAATSSDFASFEDEVMIEINQARRSAGRRQIKFYDSCVDELAEEWGAHIAVTGSFAHRDQRQVLRKCRQDWVGECLVQGTSLTPAAIVQAWLDSPAHRRILLKRRASRTGISVTTDARGNYVGVLNFSDPG